MGLWDFICLVAAVVVMVALVYRFTYYSANYEDSAKPSLPEDSPVVNEKPKPAPKQRKARAPHHNSKNH